MRLGNPVKIVAPLDKEQRAYIEGKLNELWRSRYDKPFSERAALKRAPSFVRKAERIVNRYLASERKPHETYEKRLAKFRDKVREEVLFGDPRKALKMLRTWKR